MYWFWFWFWWTLYTLMIVLDVGWWVVVMRLTKRRLWRVLASVFIAGQLAAHLAAISGVDWPSHTPKVVLVAVIIWHFLGMAVFLPLGILFVVAWMVRHFMRIRRTRRNPPLAIPASANSLTRREFFGAAAALAPPIFTFGLTGVAMAQLSHFRLRRFTLVIPALPRALDGITIAHVTDMHVGRLTCGAVLQKMVSTTNDLRADLVLMTGDLINYDLSDLAEGLALVKAMQSRYGLWMIEGNHDLFDDAAEFERRVKASGVPLLLDESATVHVRGHPVQLLGLRWMDNQNARGRDPATDSQVRELLKQRQPDAFPILLAHHPHVFDAAAEADLPLTLSGHTHGGQWMLDHRHGVGPVLFRYWSGLYTRGSSQLIVSNGAGNVIPIRVNAPAEIVHLTLRCA